MVLINNNHILKNKKYIRVLFKQKNKIKLYFKYEWRCTKKRKRKT